MYHIYNFLGDLSIVCAYDSPNALIPAESNDIYKTSGRQRLSYYKLNKKRGRMPGQLRIKGEI